MKKWKECDATDRAMFWATAALGILTAILVGYTKKQVSDMEGNVQKQLRAYVSVLTPVFGPDSLTADPLKVAFILKNTGQTPAYDLRQLTRLIIVKTDSVKNLPDPRTMTADWPQGVLAPNTDLLLWRIPDAEPMTFSGLSSKEYRICFYGKITYEDIYGGKHWTTFAYERIAQFGQFYPSPRFPTYNDADKNE